jgi:hypothetical protein
VKLLDARLVKLLVKNNKLWHLIRVPEDLESKEVSAERSPVLIPDHVCQFSKVTQAFMPSWWMTLRVRPLHRPLPKSLALRQIPMYLYPKK